MVLACTRSGRWAAQEQALGSASYWYRLRLAALRPGRWWNGSGAPLRSTVLAFTPFRPEHACSAHWRPISDDDARRASVKP